MYSTNSNCETVVNFIKRRKENLRKVFHSKCCICGYDKIQEALEFHHVNPEEKEFGICSSNSTTKALDKQLKEMKKCILVCANCHRGIHSYQLEIPNNWKEFYDDEIANSLLQELERKRYFCSDCGKEISRTSKGRCPKCASKAQQIVERPSRDKLKNLIRNFPFTRIAEQYGVSDNAIRKWCDAENLPKKKTEINSYSDEEWDNI